MVSFKQAQTALNGIEGKSPDEKLNAVVEALGGLLTGIEQMTKQANQSSQTTALLNERTNRKILKLFQSQITRIRRHSTSASRKEPIRRVSDSSAINDGCDEPEILPYQ